MYIYNTLPLNLYMELYKYSTPHLYLHLDRGLHVMATKPMVKTLKEHQFLVQKAKEKNVLLQIEVNYAVVCGVQWTGCSAVHCSSAVLFSIVLFSSSSVVLHGAVQVHKRFDPIYSDARMRIQKLGEFNFFTRYMIIVQKIR